MKTLNITISEADFNRLGLPSESLSFEDFVQFFKKEFAKKSLRNAQRAAKRAGKADMSLEEINAEIQAVRSAKSHS